MELKYECFFKAFNVQAKAYCPCKFTVYCMVINCSNIRGTNKQFARLFWKPFNILEFEKFPQQTFTEISNSSCFQIRLSILCTTLFIGNHHKVFRPSLFQRFLLIKIKLLQECLFRHIFGLAGNNTTAIQTSRLLPFEGAYISKQFISKSYPLHVK